MKHTHVLDNGLQGLLLAVLICCPLDGLAGNAWSYNQESDTLTNLTYSFAQSPITSPGRYDDIKLQIVCKENKLQAVIDADSLIASQGSRFTVEYQIDKNPPVTIEMTTFQDSKRKGYTEKDAKRIANELLTGQAIFIRVNTMIKEVLSISIPLDGAAKPVQQVFADCGLASSNNTGGEPSYTLADFERDFSKLSPEQQQQTLIKIKKILVETP